MALAGLSAQSAKHFLKVPVPDFQPCEFLLSSILLTCLVAGAASRASSTSDTNVLALDYSAIRGANYCAAGGHHLEHWLHYDPKETARDLDYAKKININQIRVFLSYAAYATNKEAFRKNLIDLARACQARGIGLMPVVSYKSEMFHESAPYPLSRAWAKDLIDTIGHEPALAFWDVFNEPDYPPDSTNRPARIAYARVMANIFRELDTRRPRTPVTIGFAFEKTDGRKRRRGGRAFLPRLQSRRARRFAATSPPPSRLPPKSTSPSSTRKSAAPAAPIPTT